MATIPEIVGLDYETFGSRDLNKVGLDNYLSDPLFKALICSTARRDENGNIVTRTFDFTTSLRKADWPAFQAMFDIHPTNWYSAHNAGFERAVTKKLDIVVRNDHFIDSAVLGRINGAHSALANAAPQLLDSDKIEEGTRLKKKFSYGTTPPGEEVLTDPDWELFKEYCEQDAVLAFLIAEKYHGTVAFANECAYEPLTAEMNQLGWPVDLVSVQLMLDRAEENKAAALNEFRRVHDPDIYELNKRGQNVLVPKLNLNSLKQLKAWCKERGIVATSFDEAHVNTLLERVSKKLTDPTVTLAKGVRENYEAVEAMLITKQVVGGSSIKKLPVILTKTGEDGRLRDQYMHCGAGQSYRTSGRDVQMQNLKKLDLELKDMATLADPSVPWTNDDIAGNIRQVFTASDEDGSLIVGDFSSVESRGLAYEAGEDWKLEAYRRKEDLYKVLAQKIYHITSLSAITKPQRNGGKVGELSCGYGAGPDAVATFAKKMYIEMTAEEAAKLVRDWRDSCPKTVELWDTLDHLLHSAVTGPAVRPPSHHLLANGLTISIAPTETPKSLLRIHPGARSLEMTLLYKGIVVFTRIFHGCYERGRNVCYYKPRENKTGPLWKDTFVDTKTKTKKYHSLYGGKLAGIMTQSLCREIFFMVLHNVKYQLVQPGLQVVGQFHDEIVLDYNPHICKLTLEQAKAGLEKIMSNPGIFAGFPLAAEVKSDYRYTK